MELSPSPKLHDLLAVIFLLLQSILLHGDPLHALFFGSEKLVANAVHDSHLHADDVLVLLLRSRLPRVIVSQLDYLAGVGEQLGFDQMHLHFPLDLLIELILLPIQ